MTIWTFKRHLVEKPGSLHWTKRIDIIEPGQYALYCCIENSNENWIELQYGSLLKLPHQISARWGAIRHFPWTDGGTRALSARLRGSSISFSLIYIVSFRILHLYAPTFTIKISRPGLWDIPSWGMGFDGGKPLLLLGVRSLSIWLMGLLPQYLGKNTIRQKQGIPLLWFYQFPHTCLHSYRDKHLKSTWLAFLSYLVVMELALNLGALAWNCWASPSPDKRFYRVYFRPQNPLHTEQI